MSEVMSQPSSSLTDSNLRQVAPLLHTYWNALHDITSQDLTLYTRHKVMYISVQIHVNVPFTVATRNEEKQHRRLHDGEVKTEREALYLTDLIKMYNDKLKHVVLKELLAEKELKKKDSPLPRKIKKLRDLKNSVEEFSKVINRISAVYTAKSLDFASTIDLPSLEDVKEVKEKLSKMKKSLKFNELCSLFEYDNDFKTYNEAILCTILGLSEDYGKWLSEMDIQMREHHVDKYYIERAIEKAENENAEEWIQSEFSGAEGLVKHLQELGFNEEIAMTISSNIPDDLIDLQKPSFWALRYLDSAFTYHPLLSNCPRYPYKEDRLDAWFKEPLPGNNSESHDASAMTPVKMINISSRTSEGNALVNLFLTRETGNAERRLLYHSTSHQHAMSIVKGGIDLKKGNTCQDFSDGDGFYLSETFEFARGFNKRPNQAIIVYTIENQLLDANQQNGWDLTASDINEWRKVIDYFKGGNRKNKEINKAVKKAVFIRGSMTRGFRERVTVQICIRDQVYANRFGSLENIACVIFY